MITLATLSEASMQDIFTQVRDHLLKQGVKSTKPHQYSGITEQICAYRGNNNTMCAVGCLISEEEYSPAMDKQGDTSFRGLTHQGLFPQLNLYKSDLLYRLQLVHDINEVRDWEDKLLAVACDFGLEWV